MCWELPSHGHFTGRPPVFRQNGPRIFGAFPSGNGPGGTERARYPVHEVRTTEEKRMRVKTSILTAFTVGSLLALGGCFMGLPTPPDDDGEDETRNGDSGDDGPSNITSQVTFVEDIEFA